MGEDKIEKPNTESKEKFEEELNRFLESMVYPELKITKEEEERLPEINCPKNWEERTQRVERISYANIRETIREFFKYYCEDTIWKKCGTI